MVLFSKSGIHRDVVTFIAAAIEACVHCDVSSYSEVPRKPADRRIEIHFIALVVSRVYQNQDPMMKIEVFYPARKYERGTGRRENRNSLHKRNRVAPRSEHQSHKCSGLQL